MPYMKKTLLILLAALTCIGANAEEHRRYIGGDISALPLYEEHNSYYKDANGKKIDDLISWFVTDCGWNTFRVRAFVHPNKKDQDGSANPSVCQDLAYVTALGKRIKDAGASFMLDFHYSDTWVDATHIQAPEAWKGLSDEEMADSVAAYTREVLTALNEAGATPDFVQVGNEIMYGLCGIKVHPYASGEDNWDGFLGLLKAGCNAVREVCPEAQIIIHTDRPTNTGYNQFFYQKLIDGEVDYDIIGLSYYPFWHGFLTDSQNSNSNLTKSINRLATDFPDKTVFIVETAYNFQYWPTSGVNVDTRTVWPCSKAGQYKFVKDLVDALKPLPNVDGICYWFPEEAGNGDDTNWNTSKGTVIPGWLNRGFWDESISQSGHAINRTGQITAGKTAADVCAPYYMGSFVGFAPQGIENVQRDDVQCTKVLRDGQLYLMYKGTMYNVQGTIVR